MKLRIFLLILLVIALLTTAVFAAEEPSYVFDEADVLTHEEEERLNQKLAQISEELGISVLAATARDNNYYLESSARTYFTRKSPSTDGLILYLAFSGNENRYHIDAYGNTANKFSERMYDKVENACVPLLRAGEYSMAISSYANTCNKQISAYGKMSVPEILLCFVIGIVLSFLIPMNILKNQLKSVRLQPEANSYIRQDSLLFRKQSDTFLYRNVTRVPKPKNSSGGGRVGGGSSGRSGRF